MWQALIPLIGKVIDNVLPDPKASAEAKLAILEMQQKGDLALLDADLKIALAQLEIGKEEAKSPNWFVAGGRPFILWVCGVAFAYATILEPLGRFIAKVSFGYVGEFPVIDTSLTMQVLMGLLGLSGLRTFEKHKGVEGNR